MKALVVYESLWGNTAAIAHAIAEGIGEGATVAHTGQVDPETAADFDLIVVGAPVHALSLPTKESKASAAGKPVAEDELAPDVTQPTVKEWLADLPDGTAAAAAFDTRIRGPLGHGGASRIEKSLKTHGYRIVDRAQGFVVINDSHVRVAGSMLRQGERKRATEWGARLASLT